MGVNADAWFFARTVWPRGNPSECKTVYKNREKSKSVWKSNAISPKDNHNAGFPRDGYRDVEGGGAPGEERLAGSY